MISPVLSNQRGVYLLYEKEKEKEVSLQQTDAPFSFLEIRLRICTSRRDVRLH